MSYNSLYYEDDSEMYFGFTPSDNNAISYWWGNTNLSNSSNSSKQSPTKISGDITVRPINKDGQGDEHYFSLDHEHDHGDHDHGDSKSTNVHAIETFEVNSRQVDISYKGLKEILGESKPLKPFILNLNDEANIIDAAEWKPKVAKKLSGFGRITLHGNEGNDELILNGEAFKNKGFQLAFSGGNGNDKVNINNIDGITGSAGLLFGFNQNNPDIPKAIRLFGPSTKIKYQENGMQKTVK